MQKPAARPTRSESKDARRRRPSLKASSSRRHVSIAALALVAVFALKLGVLLQLHRHPLLQPDTASDTSVYLQFAREVATGNLALGPGLYFVSPVYIYFFALVLWLTSSFFSVRLLQIALGTAAVALVFRTADIWHGKRAAWFAAALAALTGIVTFYEVLLVQAALDPFLTALALYLLAAALNQPAGARPMVRAALPGIAFGLHALNRPNALVAAAGVAFMSIVLLGTRRWRTVVPFAAGILLLLTPIVVRNYTIAGDLAPLSSHGGLDFYIGNNPQADGTYRTAGGITPSIAERTEDQRADARRVAEKSIGRSLDDSEVSAHYYGLAWKWILAEPGHAARLFLRKLAYVFNAAHLPLNDSYPYYVRDERNLLRFLPVGAWLLVPLGIVGIWLGAARADQPRAFLVWASYIPFYPVSVAAFFVASSYRLPLLISLCVTAGGAMDALVPKRSHESPEASHGTTIRGRRLAVAVVVIAALAIIANWRFGLDDGRAEERTRIALWMIGQERYGEVESRVAAIERDHPRPALLHSRIGRAFFMRRQNDAAVRHLERAHLLDPNSLEADLALGQALLEARRPKEAIPHLRRALEANVRRDAAGYDLARAHAASGDRTNAIRVLQGVRPARIDDGESWRALGELALELEVPRLAEGFLRQAVGVAPLTAENHEQLGLAIALGGRYEEAIGAFQQAVQLDARDASAHLNLAVAYAETGRASDARGEAENALRLDPNYERAKQFLGALQKK